MLPQIVERMNFDWKSGDWSVDHQARVVTLHGKETGDLTSAFEKQAQSAREKGWFKVLKGWRNELYGIYGPDRSLVMSMERSATPLFGVVTYGVHMTGYVKAEDSENGKMKIWVARRAKTKSTFPSMLDNTVAGGISSGEDPFESVVREAREEASLPEDIVRKGAKSCGSVSYFYVRDKMAGGETELCQPECQYVFDLELPSDVVLAPGDDEVGEFLLMEVEEVQEAFAAGEFKPNCSLVLLDFFVRHGILTYANEKDYIEIVSRLHRRLEFPTK